MSEEPDVAIRVEELSKVYRIPVKGHRSIPGSLALLLQALRGRPAAVPRGFYAFPALKPVSLTIRKGEAVGIIGRNGSGKSTLLQLVAGTLHPTTGSVRVNGTVSALLELGSGFASEYTGMENIFLNGAILGLQRDYLRGKLDEILAFAEIGDFIHQPIRTYSSGMQVRLAFAVLATVRPEILIVDEALSVGDAFFQSKCARWMESYIAGGGSLLCVSHDMFLLQRLCHRGIVFDHGEVLLDGPIAKAAALYFKLQQKEPSVRDKARPAPPPAAAEAAGVDVGELARRMFPVDFRTSERTGNRKLEILRLRSSADLLQGCQVGDWVRFEMDVQAHAEVTSCEVGIGFCDRSGQLVGGFHSLFAGIRLDPMEPGCTYTLQIEVQLQLKPRPYLLFAGLGLTLSADQWEDYDTLWDCAQIIIHGERQFWGLAPMPSRGFSMLRQQTAAPVATA